MSACVTGLYKGTFKFAVSHCDMSTFSKAAYPYYITALRYESKSEQ